MRYLVVLLLLAGCTSAPKKPIEKKKPEVAAFSMLNDEFITVPVVVADSVGVDFILDTGSGLTLISSSICKKIECQILGLHMGKRMSGQQIGVPLTKVPSLAVAGHRVADVTSGVFDLAQPGMQKIAGFLSLDYFRKIPFTIDYKHQQIRLEDDESLKAIKSAGAIVPITVKRDGDSTDVFMPLELPDHTVISVEVDTGSQDLILNEKFISEVGLKKRDLSRKTGRDETGHTYVRYFGEIPGVVRLPSQPDYGQEGVRVMFQNIIYDGLVGQHFLRDFLVTFDLPDKVIIFRQRD